MHSSFVPPRHVTIDDAALLAGTAPRTIRGYHEIGLLPEPAGDSASRRYGYDEMIQLLWIRRMTDAGLTVDDIREAFTDTAAAGMDRACAGTRTAPARSDRVRLLSEVVTDRISDLPAGSLRQADIDGLLVIEWVFGPLGAAIHATRLIAMAARPDLWEESDRVDAAEAALDDTIAVDDPRVAQVAAERHGFERALHGAIEDSGLAESDEALVDSWEAEDASDRGSARDSDSSSGNDSGSSSGWEQVTMSAVDAMRRMPYDFSPARLRCIELVEELAARDSPAS